MGCSKSKNTIYPIYSISSIYPISPLSPQIDTINFDNEYDVMIFILIYNYNILSYTHKHIKLNIMKKKLNFIKMLDINMMKTVINSINNIKNIINSDIFKKNTNYIILQEKINILIKNYEIIFFEM